MSITECDDIVNIDVIKFKQVGEQVKKMKIDTRETLKSLEYIEKLLEIIAKKNQIKPTFT